MDDFWGRKYSGLKPGIGKRHWMEDVPRKKGDVSSGGCRLIRRPIRIKYSWE